MKRHTDIAAITLSVLALLTWVVSFAAQEMHEDADKGRPDDPSKRSEWFRKQRAYPLDRVPAGARLRALQQVSQMMQAESTGVAGPLASVSWSLAGPQPTNTAFSYPTTAGRVTALAVDPSNSNVVYLGAAEGGVWKTTDGGTVWRALTDTQASLSTGSIAIAPSNDQIIYVGTGEEDFSGDSYFGLGVLKSTNAGGTWTMLSGPFAAGRMYIGSIAVHPTNPDIVLAGTSSGVYLTTDGGTAWTLVLSGADATGVMFNPSNGNTAYAALGSVGGNSKNGVYVSTNAGSTWTLDNGTGSGALPTTHMGRIAIALTPSSPSTLYAGIANSSNGDLLGLYKSTNGGSSWSNLSSIPDYCAPQCWYDDVVAVDPANANVVYAGGSEENGTLYQSLNAGTSWTNVSSGANNVSLHYDHHALAFSKTGGALFVGNDGGAWSTTNVASRTVNWTNLNASLAITQFYGGDTVNSPTLVYGGTQDNGVQQYTGAAAWTYSWCGDGGWTAVDPTLPSTVYASCAEYDIEESTLGGVVGTWSPVSSGISSSDRLQYLPPLVMDPENPQILYFGTYRVYQTKNGASSWQTISSDLTGGSGTLTAVSVAPSNDEVVYAGTSNGLVQVTSNAGTGASWTKISTGLPAQSVTQIAVSPTTSATAYVTFSGFPSGAGEHIFKTTNTGSTWTDISKALPNTPVNDLVVDPTYANTLYAATDVGVFYTTNGGTTWTTLMSGLPNVVVLGLRMYQPTRTLWAATHGRGMWNVSVSSIQ
jgi:photosystem II stability/assembly factor-like uncharacterized protein